MYVCTYLCMEGTEKIYWNFELKIEMRRTIENWGFNLNINIERRGRL